MKELKFRAWDLEEKEMYEVQSINFLTKEMELYTYYWHGGDNFERDVIKTHMTYKLEGYDVIKYDVIQYTGKNDKNDNEIFEGNIVQITSIDPNGKSFIGRVIFNGGIYWLENDNNTVLLFDSTVELEIIGDVHTDYNLLNKKLD